MRKAVLALLLAAGASLATVAGSNGVSAAGVSVPRSPADAGQSAVVRVGYYGWRRRHYCCGPRYYRRRPVVYGYYTPPVRYYAPPPVYYPPPVVYYPPPVVYYPAPVVYGGYAPVAPYRHYGGIPARYYGSYYGW